MALSYIAYTATSGQTEFAFSFPVLSPDHVKVQIDGADIAAYTVSLTPTQKVVLTSGAANGAKVKVYRLTPGRSASPDNVNLVNFVNGSVLSEEDLDKSNNQLLYLIQEAQDTGGGALPYDAVIGAWNATNSGNKKISNVLNPTSAQDAATKSYVDAAAGVAANASNLTSGTVSSTLLPNSGATAGTYGDGATPLTQVTVDAKGRVTAASERAIVAEDLPSHTHTASQITDFNTTVDGRIDTKIAANALSLSGGQWDAENLKIQNLANPQNPNDAVTRAYVDALSVYGGAAIQPQSWTFTLNNTTDWTDLGGGVDPASRYRATKQLAGLLSYDVNTLIVSFGGVLQTPSNAYTLSNDYLSLYSATPTAGNLTVRNFGVSRSAAAPATASLLGSVKIGNNITVQQDGTISVASFPTLATVATTGSYTDLSNTPTLGNAAALTAPSAGVNATGGQLVKGDDTRLTDSRTPVSHTHNYATDITNKPSLGTSSSLDVPATGDASATQVVKGNDTRLTNSRTPTAHTHAISDVTNLAASLSALMPLAGGSFSGAPTYASDPASANELSRKQYVDSSTRIGSFAMASVGSVGQSCTAGSVSGTTWSISGTWKYMRLLHGSQTYLAEYGTFTSSISLYYLNGYSSIFAVRIS